MPRAGGPAGAGGTWGCAECPHCHGDVSPTPHCAPVHAVGLLAIGLGAVPAPAELPGAALGTGQPLVQQAGSRQVPTWGGEALLSPRRPAGLGLGGPQQPPALTGGKTDGRGCVFSCSRPTHGHQLTGMGWGGKPQAQGPAELPWGVCRGHGHVWGASGLGYCGGGWGPWGHGQGRSSRHWRWLSVGQGQRICVHACA